MIKYLLLGIILILLSCAGTKEPVKQPVSQAPQPKYDESFDPLTLNDDDITINSDRPKSDSESKPVETEVPVVEMKKREVNGFRVQILATNNIETASLTEQEATDRFEPLEHKTYLLFEAPLYKVRIGDCLTRSAAEELRETALSLGYNGAFIVKTKVIVEN